MFLSDSFQEFSQWWASKRSGLILTTKTLEKFIVSNSSILTLLSSAIWWRDSSSRGEQPFRWSCLEHSCKGDLRLLIARKSLKSLVSESMRAVDSLGSLSRSCWSERHLAKRVNNHRFGSSFHSFPRLRFLTWSKRVQNCGSLSRRFTLLQLLDPPRMTSTLSFSLSRLMAFWSARWASTTSERTTYSKMPLTFWEATRPLTVCHPSDLPCRLQPFRHGPVSNQPLWHRSMKCGSKFKKRQRREKKRPTPPATPAW